MPYFVVKVTMPNGALRLPVIANALDEQSAIHAVQLMSDSQDTVEVRGVADAVALEAFGRMPEGAVVFREDWVWRGEDYDALEPY